MRELHKYARAKAMRRRHQIPISKPKGVTQKMKKIKFKVQAKVRAGEKSLSLEKEHHRPKKRWGSRILYCYHRLHNPKGGNTKDNSEG